MGKNGEERTQQTVQKSLELMLLFNPSKTELHQGGGKEKQGHGSDLVHYVESMLPSCSRSTGMLTDKSVFALLDGSDLWLGRNHDGVLIYELAGGVGEGRQGQGDPLHLALIGSLLMLLF